MFSDRFLRSGWNVAAPMKCHMSAMCVVLHWKDEKILLTGSSLWKTLKTVEIWWRYCCEWVVNVVCVCVCVRVIKTVVFYVYLLLLFTSSVAIHNMLVGEWRSEAADKQWYQWHVTGRAWLSAHVHSFVVVLMGARGIFSRGRQTGIWGQKSPSGVQGWRPVVISRGNAWERRSHC